MGLSQKAREILLNSIPPDLDIQELITSQDNFQAVTSVDASDDLYRNRPDDLAKFYHQHVVVAGRPLVLRDMNRLLDKSLYTPDWLRSDNYGATHEIARDLLKGEDVTMSVNHYLKSLKVLQKQVDKHGYTSPLRQLLYMKDIECPPQWQDDLQVRLPPFLWYMNNNCSSEGLPAVPADLMSCLPQEMRAVNLQLYVGHESTFTPTHRDMCGALGQNLMVWASQEGFDKHIGCETKKGTSIWFMTEHKDRHVVAEYWRATLKQDIDMENHLATLKAWRNAPFTVYIVEQGIGDLVLVPSMSPHQVHNRAVTVKVAWNRTTVDTLAIAMKEALLSSRLVCRSEQYKCRSITYYALYHYSHLLEHCENVFRNGELDFDIDSPIKRNLKIIKEEFCKLFSVFEGIMLQEMFSDSISPPEQVQKHEYDGSVICSFCSCNIFNRFLTCKHCEYVNEAGEAEPYDICMDCFTMGRSCKCISKFQWAEQFDWQELTSSYTIWRQQALSFGSTIQMDLPEDLNEIRNRTGKKSLAAVCQEQLEARAKPINIKAIQHIQGEANGTNEEADQEASPASLPDGVSFQGKSFNVTKLKHLVDGKYTSAYRADSVGCHCCRWPHAKWQQRKCSNESCDQEYCYGVLWRAFDLLPLQIMEDPNWVCPRCSKTCNCGVCRDKPGFTPHIPARATLGHKTLAAADSRSVETLIDFRKGNAHWLKTLRGAVDTDSSGRAKKLKKLQEDASKESHSADYSLVSHANPHFTVPPPPPSFQQPPPPTAPPHSSQNPLGPPSHNSLIDPALEFLDLTPNRPQPESLHERTGSNPNSQLASEKALYQLLSRQRDEHISDNFTSLLYPQEVAHHSPLLDHCTDSPDTQLEAQFQSQLSECLHHSAPVLPYQSPPTTATPLHLESSEVKPANKLKSKPRLKRHRPGVNDRVVSDIKFGRSREKARPEPSKRKTAQRSLEHSDLSEDFEEQITPQSKPVKKRSKAKQVPAGEGNISTPPLLTDKGSSLELSDSARISNEALPGNKSSHHSKLPLRSSISKTSERQDWPSVSSSEISSEESAAESGKDSNFSDTQPTSAQRKSRQRATSRLQKSTKPVQTTPSPKDLTPASSPSEVPLEIEKSSSFVSKHHIELPIRQNFVVLIPEMDPTVPKRGRGRPRKHPLPEEAQTPPKVSTAKRSANKHTPRTSSDPSSPVPSEISTPRTNNTGWTPINSPAVQSEAADSDAIEEEEIEASAPTPVKRGRGRPRKADKHQPPAKKQRVSARATRSSAAQTESERTKSTGTQTSSRGMPGERAATPSETGPDFPAVTTIETSVVDRKAGSKAKARTASVVASPLKLKSKGQDFEIYVDPAEAAEQDDESSEE